MSQDLVDELESVSESGESLERNALCRRSVDGTMAVANMTLRKMMKALLPLAIRYIF